MQERLNCKYVCDSFWLRWLILCCVSLANVHTLATVLVMSRCIEMGKIICFPASERTVSVPIVGIGPVRRHFLNPKISVVTGNRFLHLSVSAGNKAAFL